jgi:hypothetical protein
MRRLAILTLAALLIAPLISAPPASAHTSGPKLSAVLSHLKGTTITISSTRKRYTLTSFHHTALHKQGDRWYPVWQTSNVCATGQPCPQSDQQRVQAHRFGIFWFGIWHWIIKHVVKPIWNNIIKRCLVGGTAAVTTIGTTRVAAGALLKGGWISMAVHDTAKVSKGTAILAVGAACLLNVVNGFTGNS